MLRRLDEDNKSFLTHTGFDFHCWYIFFVVFLDEVGLNWGRSFSEEKFDEDCVVETWGDDLGEDVTNGLASDGDELGWEGFDEDITGRRDPVFD